MTTGPVCANCRTPLYRQWWNDKKQAYECRVCKTDTPGMQLTSGPTPPPGFAFCPQCATPHAETDRYCPKCGYDFGTAVIARASQPETTGTQLEFPPIPPPKDAPTRTIGLVVLAVIVLGVLYVLGNLGDSDGGAGSDPPPPAAQDEPETPWWPDDYSPYPGDASVAWRWQETSEFDCTYSSGTCFGMEVIARDGCPTTLYVELTLHDDGGASVGFTNDTAGSLTPGQHAKLVFDTFDEGVDRARLAEISCF